MYRTYVERYVTSEHIECICRKYVEYVCRTMVCVHCIFERCITYSDVFLHRFDMLGLYVVMFQEILKTMVKTLTVFFILIVGFAISFYMLLCENVRYDRARHNYNGITVQSQIQDFPINVNKTSDVLLSRSQRLIGLFLRWWYAVCSQRERFDFQAPGLSIVTTIIMMLGNIEYVDNWVTPYAESTMSHKISFGLLIVFVLYMPIIVINLLVRLWQLSIDATFSHAYC